MVPHPVFHVIPVRMLVILARHYVKSVRLALSATLQQLRFAHHATQEVMPTTQTALHAPAVRSAVTLMYQDYNYASLVKEGNTFKPLERPIVWNAIPVNLVPTPLDLPHVLTVR